MNSISSFRSYLNNNHEKVRKVLGTLTCIFQVVALSLSARSNDTDGSITYFTIGAIIGLLLLLHSKSRIEAIQNLFFVMLPIPLYLSILSFCIWSLGLILHGLTAQTLIDFSTLRKLFGLRFLLVFFVIWIFILGYFGNKITVYIHSRIKKQTSL